MRLLHGTVASVLASFQKNLKDLKDLEVIAEVKAREAETIRQRIQRETQKAAAADTERDHALRVHAKIKELIG